MLVKIKIYKLVDRIDSFTVIYEIKEKKHQHAFPKNNGWEVEDKNGVPKFITRLLQMHKEEQKEVNQKYINKEYELDGGIK